MSIYATTLPLQSNGNVKPKQFVKLDTSASLLCAPCGAGDSPIGISGNFTRFAPGTGADDGFESVAGEFQGVFPVGCVTPLQCATAWTTGAYLKPTATGFGAPTTAASDIAGAIALTDAAAGEQADVLVILPSAAGITVATVVVTAVDLTLTAANSGQVIQVTAADKTVTLPAGVVGQKFKIVCTGTASSGGTVGTTVAVPTGSTLNGQLVTGTAITAASGKGAINTHATAITGDFLEVTCLAALTYWVTDIQGVWARVA